MSLHKEIARRRALAIISHPDAGKTTLTEKFLLYGGAVQLAGSVTARKQQRAATSDWMELERKRGISVSSTVLQFDYDGYFVNLLDTPGHKDFSEDTYRVLTAVDGVIMVIDAGKGIESQTRKLFEVCRRRGVPIFTFMNKLDRPSRNPLDLMDELESVLGIGAYAMNWPLGNGQDFKGVYDRQQNQVHFFERVAHGSYRAPVSIHGIEDDAVKSQMSEMAHEQVTEEIELLDMAGVDYDTDAVLAGRQTPVFWGSAANNFGVQLLLDGFLSHSSPPRARVSSDKKVIEPHHEAFSGFIFKIQANMDPKHRDRIAFLRICSGKFTRDMSVTHSRSTKKVRLSSSHKLFGNDRETMDEAYPGDILGIVGHDAFGIGDTLTEDPRITFGEMPRFTPEHFAFLHSTNTGQFKRFRAGMEQLLQEGVVQALHPRNSAQRVPLLAAIGPLQFEVVKHRLEAEYNAETRLEGAPWTVLRWVSPEISNEHLEALSLPSGARLADDSKGQPVLLFSAKWELDYFVERNEEVELSEFPFAEELTDSAG